MTSKVLGVVTVIIWTFAFGFGFMLPLLWHERWTNIPSRQCEFVLMMKQEYLDYLLVPLFMLFLIAVVCMYISVFRIAYSHTMKNIIYPSVQHDLNVHNPSVHDLNIHNPSVHDLNAHNPSVYDPNVHNDSVHDLNIHNPSVHDLNVYNNPSQSQLNSNQVRAQLKTLKTCAVVFGIFFLCWIPFLIALAVQIYGGLQQDKTAGRIRTYATLLAFLNSGLNPLIYAYRMEVFQTRMKKILLCRS